MGYQNTTNYYYVSFNESNDGNTSGIFRYRNGVITQLADITVPITAGTSYAIKVEPIGSTILAYRNDTLVAAANDPSFTVTSSKVGFGTRNNGATFDNLIVRQ